VSEIIEPQVGGRYYWRGNPNDSEWIWGEVLAISGSYVWAKPLWKSRRSNPFRDLALEQFVVYIPQTLPWDRLKAQPGRTTPRPWPHEA
jgi:hypothetical protein